jgi:hypothetical protein
MNGIDFINVVYCHGLLNVEQQMIVRNDMAVVESDIKVDVVTVMVVGRK